MKVELSRAFDFITKTDYINRIRRTQCAEALQPETYIAFWKIHILHHAADSPTIGQWMLKELRHHGYDISPGTLYPILHRMHALGWLSCSVDEARRKRAAKYYSITPEGIVALKLIHKQLAELKREVIPGA